MFLFIVVCVTKHISVCCGAEICISSIYLFFLSAISEWVNSLQSFWFEIVFILKNIEVNVDRLYLTEASYIIYCGVNSFIHLLITNVSLVRDKCFIFYLFIYLSYFIRCHHFPIHSQKYLEIGLNIIHRHIVFFLNIPIIFRQWECKFNANTVLMQ